VGKVACGDGGPWQEKTVASYHGSLRRKFCSDPGWVAAAATSSHPTWRHCPEDPIALGTTRLCLASAMPALGVIDHLAGGPSALLCDGLDGDSKDAAAESLIVELV
jgi:hypothetical protein